MMRVEIHVDGSSEWWEADQPYDGRASHLWRLTMGNTLGSLGGTTVELIGDEATLRRLAMGILDGLRGAEPEPAPIKSMKDVMEGDQSRPYLPFY